LEREREREIEPVRKGATEHISKFYLFLFSVTLEPHMCRKGSK
jgi:hypothetical protein